MTRLASLTVATFAPELMGFRMNVRGAMLSTSDDRLEIARVTASRSSDTLIASKQMPRKGAAQIQLRKGATLGPTPVTEAGRDSL